MIIVTSPFYWYHAVTLTMTFDQFQGQICCRVGDHKYSNLLVFTGGKFCINVHQTVQVVVIFKISMLFTYERQVVIFAGGGGLDFRIQS